MLFLQEQENAILTGIRLWQIFCKLTNRFKNRNTLKKGDIIYEFQQLYY